MSLPSVWWRSVKDAPFYVLMFVGFPLGLALDCIGVSLARRTPGEPIDVRRIRHALYCGLVTVGLTAVMVVGGLIGEFMSASPAP